MGNLKPYILNISALINAIYFKGLFQHPFDGNKTRDSIFHGVHGDTTVAMMKQERKFFYCKTDNYQAIKLEYNHAIAEQAKYETVVILPESGKMQVILEQLRKDTSILTHGFSSLRVQLQRLFLLRML